jgi:hypothetical protein
MGAQQSSAGAMLPDEVVAEAPAAALRKGYLDRLGIGRNGVGGDRFSKGLHNLELVREEFEEQSSGFDTPDTTSEAPLAEDEDGNSKILLRRADFRVNYLKTLAYSKVWVPPIERPPKHQTVIIFDWDDTLLCTSWLSKWGDRFMTHEIQAHLRGIASAAKRLIETAQRMGQTLIITNAMSGWVEHSAAKWVPELLPVLRNVRVISARSNWEPAYPGDVSRWKEQAFLAVQQQLRTEIIANLISVGDSHWEMDAVHSMGKGFEQALVKTVKLRQDPYPDELRKELELIGQKFDKIVENARDLKITLEKK